MESAIQTNERPEPEELDHSSSSSGPLLPLLLAAGLAMLLIGGLIGYWLGGTRAPGADSVDVGFARDMSIHHEQAVQMAALIYDRSDDSAVRSLAFDILTTQQGQIGIMSGWLDTWKQAWTSAGPRMEWMGMAVEGLMPGMATPEQMAALRGATGIEADVLFLELMIPHHVAGVEMAEYAQDHATQEPVRLLARGMAEAQTLEIDYMKELLAAKGVTAPATAPAAGESNNAGEHDH